VLLADGHLALCPLPGRNAGMQHFGQYTEPSEGRGKDRDSTPSDKQFDS